jgi:hypothetical protein
MCIGCCKLILTHDYYSRKLESDGGAGVTVMYVIAGLPRRESDCEFNNVFCTRKIMSKSASTRRVRQRTRANNQMLKTPDEFRLPPLRTEYTLEDQLDVEIECPRCRDVMELFSKFDYLSYYCGSCRLELNVN